MEYLKYTPEMSANFTRALFRVHNEYPWLMDRVQSSMTTSQLESKLWIGTQMQELGLKGHALLIGGWYAHFVTEMLMEVGCGSVSNVDIDTHAKLISYMFNQRYVEQGKFMGSHTNLFYADDDLFEAVVGFRDIVVNTSCEHMFPMWKLRDRFNKLGRYPTFILQSTNDDRYIDHINCVNSTDELIDQAGLIDVMYEGERELPNGMIRYMVIGR